MLQLPPATNPPPPSVMGISPVASPFQSGSSSAHAEAKSIICAAAPCATHAVDAQERAPPRGDARWVGQAGPIGDRQTSQLRIGPLVLNVSVDALTNRFTASINHILPPAYPGAAPMQAAVFMTPLPQPLVYPTPNPHGGHPIVNPSFNVNLAQTQNFPVRGQISGAVRTNAIGQLCFAIHYQVYVRNSRGPETMLTNFVEVLQL